MIPLEGASDISQLGIVIRQRRIDSGWTQGQLATQAKVSQGALSTFERSGSGLSLDGIAAVLSAVGLTLCVLERSEYDDAPVQESA